jgi:uncharacterized protein YbjT (DUF2867 family)
MAAPKVHVIGASGRTGAALAAALGPRLVPVVRNAAKWAALGFGAEPRIAELEQPGPLTEALRDATHIVSCVHARYATEIVDAAPPDATFVFLGSTRRFTRWPDEHGDFVVLGEYTFRASRRRGVILHPTMIYGADGEDNVRRLAALARRFPVLPLPGGGRSLVQPIHQSDVTRSILAALDREWTKAEAIVIAGPEPIAYRDFVLAVAAASGAGRPRIVSIPAMPLRMAAALIRLIPGLPRIEGAEIRRLQEDKAFDIGTMRSILGVTPISLAEGLALTFGPAQV